MVPQSRLKFLSHAVLAQSSRLFDETVPQYIIIDEVGQIPQDLITSLSTNHTSGNLPFSPYKGPKKPKKARDRNKRHRRI